MIRKLASSLTVRRNPALATDQRGAAIAEFGLIAPVVAMVLMGVFDFSYNIYANTLLEGAIQKAARDSTIEGSTVDTLDLKVTEAVEKIAPNADITFARTSYGNFDEVGRPEDFTDVNDDGLCNDGEPFEDVNANGIYDQDPGRGGNGGARDAVLYTVTVTYGRAFPLAGLIGVSNDVTTQARTVLRNQPYGLQNLVPPAVGACT